MFADRVISDGGLVRTDTGFTLDIRIPWYRALPLSTVKIDKLKIDGQGVCPDAIRFEVNGKSFALNELHDHPEEWWYVLDSAYLQVKDTPLQSGTEHDVSVSITLKPPYIPGFSRQTEHSKRLTAR